MVGMVLPLLNWLPVSFRVIALGVVAIFVISFILRVICFIIDLIPFL